MKVEDKDGQDSVTFSFPDEIQNIDLPDLDNEVSDNKSITEDESVVKDQSVDKPVNDDLDDDLNELDKSDDLNELDKSDTANDDLDSSSDDSDDDSDLDTEAYIDSYKLLVEQGLAPEKKDNEINPEYVEKHIENLPYYLVGKAIDDLPKYTKDLFELAFIKGKDLSDSDLINYFENLIEPEYTKSEIEDKDDAISFLENKLSNQDIYKDDPDLLEAYLEKLKSKDDDYVINKAVAIIDKEKQEFIKAQEKAQEEKLNRDKEYVEQFEKEIDKSTLRNRKPQIIKAVSDSENILKSISNNPKALIKLGDILSYFDEKTGDLDLGTFIKNTNPELYKDASTKKDLLEEQAKKKSTFIRNRNKKANKFKQKFIFDD